jgi:O-antigen/teichoic acid export membrane protein
MPVFSVLGEEIGVLVFNSPECGKYLSASSFLMVFMSLSNLTTSMLNSIGKEHQTLVYYIISGIFMLLSIWFLPKFVGVYALLVGFSFVYGLTTVLNLLLLNKHCKEKPNYMSFSVSAVILTIPTIIFGLMAEPLLKTFLGDALTLVLLGGSLVVINTLLYLVFGLIDIKIFKNKLPVPFLKKKKA